MLSEVSCFGDKVLLVHCNTKFRPEEIQFLKDNDMFTHRRLEIGVCPRCEKLLARFIEKRILDDKIFDTTYKNERAERVIKELKDDILYTNLDTLKQDGLYGYRYGINTERTNKTTGETTVTQKACDFYGNKEVVKKFKTN